MIWRGHRLRLDKPPFAIGIGRYDHFLVAVRCCLRRNHMHSGTAIVVKLVCTTHVNHVRGLALVANEAGAEHTMGYTLKDHSTLDRTLELAMCLRSSIYLSDGCPYRQASRAHTMHSPVPQDGIGWGYASGSTRKPLLLVSSWEATLYRIMVREGNTVIPPAEECEKAPVQAGAGIPRRTDPVGSSPPTCSVKDEMEVTSMQSLPALLWFGLSG